MCLVLNSMKLCIELVALCNIIQCHILPSLFEVFSMWAMLSLQAGFGLCKKSGGEVGHIAGISAPPFRTIPGSNFVMDDARS